MRRVAILEISRMTHGLPSCFPLARGVAQAGVHPLWDQITLQSRDCGHDGEHSGTQRGGGVDVLLVADELNAQGAELLERQQQMLGGPSEAITKGAAGAIGAERSRFVPDASFQPS